ncbi:hypothetical protein L0U85_00405 [Glycomyces sp. L485]|uniref:hypothetical protein n=1 Tax=Glycomyces sp. L485 TaxID=2909235 RepID=UPI001F4A67FB|nr:hypothetical protein [Glycomyces sp. L485]MCH7229332.1 hypothetical protein [Glycomyces sp. L485]
MFSNLSPIWRKRLRVIVAAWALLLVAVAFLASGASVREQVEAPRAREDMDAVIGEAALYLTGEVYFLSVGPLEVGECDVTPLRPGVALARTLMIERSHEVALEGLADRFGLARSGSAAPTWIGTTAGYIEVRVTEIDPGISQVRVSTGCRPADGLGVFRPAPPAEADASWNFGAVDCPGGGRLESWTTPSTRQPLAVEDSDGGCV